MARRGWAGKEAAQSKLITFISSTCTVWEP